MKDKNGNHLEILDTVAIPEPSADDIWNNEFVATIVDVDSQGNLIVEDQDSDFWTVEPHRVELID